MHVVENTLGVEVGVFLARPLFAHLATASPEGPRDSPVWYLWDDGDETLWIDADTASNTFTDRIEADPRCAVGVVDSEPERGLIQHVGVRGRATVEPFDRERAERLYARYLGPDVERWDARFSTYIRDPPPTAALVRVEPETVVARDQSYRPAPGY
ncbi:pyridoxamine 5'-phosphate oxidase family protein [Halosegnis marinus]|uniref:Pyridoxamine 5'-phosphate oxidase family protein n=1 Tax=Halosegnis marinus TaxID=3034023 RepID=A0ABD5ZM34_9EURY|nr:pyridoxamine 5'-phosphate oxidase family protein [Halosegnis sp. DT85]